MVDIVSLLMFMFLSEVAYCENSMETRFNFIFR